MSLEAWAKFFEPRVALRDGCLVWKKRLNKFGYGSTTVRGKRTVLTHRYAWELAYGPIPEGRCVCHHCDNRACQNPMHLFLGTHAENMADRNRKGRQKGGANDGERNGHAKLTKANALAIRTSNMPAKILAEQFDISRSQIYKIRYGQTWRHV